jgi:hypothetical protein
MKKAHIQNMPAYFDRYIHLTDDVTYMQALEISLEELENAPLEKWKALGEKTYAPGKWTIKDILQHYIDTERVFTYRITAIARGDQQLMTPYDEEMYAANAQANRRTVEELWSELILVRKGTISMYQSFTPEMLQQQGHGYNGVIYGPLALGFMLAGHQRWHFRVIKEKYEVLLNE